MRPPAVEGALGISGCGGELALAALCGDCDAPPRVWVGWRGCDLFLHPLRPCRNQRQLILQPAAAFSGGRHGRGGRGLIFLLRLAGRAGAQLPPVAAGPAAPAPPTALMAAAILRSAFHPPAGGGAPVG